VWSGKGNRDGGDWNMGERRAIKKGGEREKVRERRRRREEENELI
jgi:hypothetical protein